MDLRAGNEGPPGEQGHEGTELQTLADLRGWSPPVALQIEWSLVRTVEHVPNFAYGSICQHSPLNVLSLARSQEQLLAQHRWKPDASTARGGAEVAH